MPEEGIELREKEEFMTSEEIIYMAKTFVDLGVKKIRLTGGEPLIKKDITHILKELGKLPIELAITTNAVVADQFIDVFKEAGLKSINVSLDSLNFEKVNTITRRNYGERIISNIKLLIANDFNVKVNAVVIKGVNDNEIIDFINWTKDLNIDVRFIEFMPFDGNKWDWDKKVSYKEILNTVNSHFSNDELIRLEEKPNDTAKNYKIKGFKGSFGVISPVTNPFCDTCNRIRLTADGKIKNCLFSTDESDLLGALRNGKDIIPLIFDSITNKKKERAGITSFNNKASKKLFSMNRSMTTIGG
jgi:cyclic pyranopterin phosphate synthase